MARWDTLSTLAFALVGAFVAVIVILIFHPLPNDGTSNALFGLIGVLGTMATGVATYFFGSSKSSQEKDAARDNTMNTLVNKVVENGKEKTP